MKKLFLLTIAVILFNISIFSQELNCRVSVNYSQLQTTNTQIFQSLQRDITEYMNTTRWTDYTFAHDERIECNVMITITQFNGMDRFTSTI